jgi:hypothetical protein
MRTLAIAAALLLALSTAGCRSESGSGTPAPEVVAQRDAEEILESSPWLDKVPQDERDVINVFVFQDAQGAYLIGNSYKATIEMFRYWVEDGEIKAKFLDENKTYKSGFKIERYKGEIFDYKLTFTKSPRGPKVYYGFDQGRELPDWVSKINGLVATP